MNPNDIFWLARYAHNEVTPLIKADVRLIIHLNFRGDHNLDGIDIWVMPPDERGRTIQYKTGVKTKEQADQFVATLQPLEVGIAA
jgi:hypothetical protein